MVSREPHPAELREWAQIVFEVRAKTGNAGGQSPGLASGLELTPRRCLTELVRWNSIPGSGPAPQPRIRSGSPRWNG